MGDAAAADNIPSPTVADADCHADASVVGVYASA
jgi:hypothetical protein